MKKILLVDDSEADRALLRRFLSRAPGESLHLLEASTAAGALQQFSLHRPDCILVDYNLPDGNGLDLLEQFKQLVPPETLCLVMITGSDSAKLAVQVLSNGALDYLIKGQFDQELLLKVVRHALERNEWRQYQARYHEELQRVNQDLRQSLSELTLTRQELSASNQQLLTANTEVEARNRALDTANRQLARTNQDLDNFVYAASHDLKQPIMNLHGLFNELKRVCAFQDQDSREIIRLTESSIKDLMTTITDLSVVVHDSRQPLQSIREEVPVADLVLDVQQALLPQIKENHAALEHDLQELPVVLYNRGHLRTILHNLISNALRYRHPERPPHIRIRTWRNDDQQQMLSISDNGMGIDLSRYQHELFHLFRRFHPDTAEGTGVGLFLVNRIVQSHGGQVQVESQVGEGTTFCILLSDK